METTEKQRAIDALKTLPDQATMEDAIERLCFIAKIEEGLRQSDAGQLVSHDEVKRQFLSCEDSSGRNKPVPTSLPFKPLSVRIPLTTLRS